MVLLADLPPEALAVVLENLVCQPNGDTMALLLTGNVIFGQKLDRALRQIVLTLNIKKDRSKPSCFDIYITNFQPYLFPEREGFALLNYFSSIRNKITKISVDNFKWSRVLLQKFPSLTKLNTAMRYSKLGLNCLVDLPCLCELDIFINLGFSNIVTLPNITTLSIGTHVILDLAKIFPNLTTLMLVCCNQEYVVVSELMHLEKLEIIGDEVCPKVIIENPKLKHLRLENIFSIDTSKINFSNITYLYLDYVTSTNMADDQIEKIVDGCASKLEVLKFDMIDVINNNLHKFTNLRNLCTRNVNVNFANIKSKKLVELDCQNCGMYANEFELETLPLLKRLFVGELFKFDVVPKLNLLHIKLDLCEIQILNAIPLVIHVPRVEIDLFDCLNDDLYKKIMTTFVKNHKGITSKRKLFDVCRHFIFWTPIKSMLSNAEVEWKKIFSEYISLGYMDSFNE
jgi:hypothetical protein